MYDFYILGPWVQNNAWPRSWQLSLSLCVLFFFTAGGDHGGGVRRHQHQPHVEKKLKVLKLSELINVLRLPPNAEACPMVRGWVLPHYFSFCQSVLFPLCCLSKCALRVNYRKTCLRFVLKRQPELWSLPQSKTTVWTGWKNCVRACFRWERPRTMQSKDQTWKVTDCIYSSHCNRVVFVSNL